jgi:XapX domain-containing protein
MDDLRTIILALICGMMVGLIFSALRLDVPGPTTMVSISGIIGLYIGMIIIRHIRAH